MRKRIVPVVLVLLLIFAIAYLVATRKGKEKAAGLPVSGNIEAHESVVGFKVQGRLAELAVEEGQWVKAGDLIARLDQADYRQQVGIEESGVKTRQADLGLTLSGSRVQEKRSAEQAVVDAKATLDLNRADFQRYQALYEKDEVSAQIRDGYRTGYERAQAAYERARQNLSQVLEGARKEQVAVSRAGVEQARQALELSRIKLGYTTLTAPLSGVVLVRQAELGEVLGAGAPVVTIADLDHLWLRGYVAETDLGRVKLGAAATVKSDTYPGKSYRGRVSFISSQAEFTPKSVETHKERVTLVYRIKIDLDNPAHELKPGMPADAVIDTGEAR
ncbi:efflux RND transporter periplasmic adaptor subunit [Geomonas sp. Red32]|uniref:HlyD family secretion protein n=1 Tax=Geomonas sp. Red32 TaxID=2912856 RepID=UPI00202CC1C9|nr:efflux RND transporter periplasmic adaptor subunit [Geomonas sp. Red32]MCM0082925.1 efflux RND transporter periplasmic adaptor subunit [Geomonas sp. Red32]